MIKAKISTVSEAGEPRAMLVIGLSGENVTRLVAGEPILTKLDELGFAGMDLAVLYGKTEDEIVVDLKKLDAAAKGRP